MIQLVRPPLSTKATEKLAAYQKNVNEQPDFSAQVVFAKADFPKKNVLTNRTFNEVKQKLLEMSTGAERCHYCEDSKADEVEHLLPKDVYPNICFDWNNYFYACGNCNGPKNNKCAIIEEATGGILHISTPTTPPIGTPAIIDPTRENPLDFFLLDLQNGSFHFSELPDLGTIDYLRARYTLEILRLNKRAFLGKARKEAFQNYKARLTEYIIERNQGASSQQIDNIVLGIKEAGHPTVWQEMKRQSQFIPALKTLFDQAQEALTW